jgi:hypothetical protein
MKIGRNQPCPCGSGNKFKRCCGRLGSSAPFANTLTRLRRISPERTKAQELIRQRQQGLGKPIISTKIGDYRVVMVGNEVQYSTTWKVFPDFLGHYLKNILGPDWGNAELAKPLDQRHTILQWYDRYCAFQKRNFDPTCEIQSAQVTGIVHCYLNLAYNLYLLKHNVELQDRLLKRLRDSQQFQGAYYELIIANCLIRSGFKLELEDESDEQRKHCEFSAVSHLTGRKYWVEAKMRSVDGILGKTKFDGTSRNDPTEMLTRHLREALLKPADSQRLIFLDVNTPTQPMIEEPSWVIKAARRLQDRERNTPLDQSAYVFVTNVCFHHHLDDCHAQLAIMAYGLNIPDFAKAGRYQLRDLYHAKQKHMDAHRIIDVFRTYHELPPTFDGSLPSEGDGSSRPRLLVGETYFFEDIDGGVLATVTSAVVSEGDKEAIVAVHTRDDRALILRERMTEEQLADYRLHKDTYFGVQRPATQNTNDPFEFFEWMMQVYAETSKEQLCEFCKDAPDASRLRELSRDDLALELCERMTMSVINRSRQRASLKTHPGSDQPSTGPESN